MLTYHKDDRLFKLTGQYIPIDFTLKQANEEIDLFTIEEAKRIVLETVRGNFTIQDAITQEINFHQQILENCTVLGFGNSCRLAVHCIRIFTELSEIESIPLTISDGNTQQTETEEEQEQIIGNDLTLSTIEDWLFDFKEKMSEADYKNLVSALMQYFKTGTFPTLLKPIKTNGRLNKKRLGWALNKIFESQNKGIEKELLQFANRHISLFTDVQFDENNIRSGNLYKYFTTKPK